MSTSDTPTPPAWGRRYKVAVRPALAQIARVQAALVEIERPSMRWDDDGGAPWPEQDAP